MKLKHATIITWVSFLLLAPNTLSCKNNGSDTPYYPPENNAEKIDTYLDGTQLKKYRVFNSGEDGVNSYRIPTLVCTKSGTLIAGCEARKESWRDKSPTDVVVKRSADGGETWSEIIYVARQSGSQAYMDPTAIVDEKTGRIYIFMTRWIDTNAQNTLAFMSYSDDDGITWSAPSDVSEKFTSTGEIVTGFGPGAGFQINAGKYKNRLILPARYLSAEGKNEFRTIFSDDNGMSWKAGYPKTPTGELQMAEIGSGNITMNMRTKGKRYVAFSTTGGETWSTPYIDPMLEAPSGGCQGSVLGNDTMLFFTSPKGGTASVNYDERSNFIIWRSINNGKTWGQNYSIYSKAAGYSCMANLPGGNLAVVFETADTEGFTRIDGNRPAGWLRLDIVIIPKEIRNKNAWIK